MTTALVFGAGGVLLGQDDRVPHLKCIAPLEGASVP